MTTDECLAVLRKLVSYVQKYGAAAVSTAAPVQQPQAPPVVVVWGPVEWQGLRECPRYGIELDVWFMEFEDLVAGHGVPEWGRFEEFMLCPRVSLTTKGMLLEAGLKTYGDIRLHLLRSRGAAFATGVWRHRIHTSTCLAGTKAKVVVAQLEIWRRLYNRAAQDVGEPRMSENELLLPCAAALSEADRRQVMINLRRLAASETPLHDLLSLVCPMLSSHGSDYCNAEDSSADDCTADGSPELVASKTRPRRPRRRRCAGCWGTCQVRATCPAFGRVCFYYQKFNHFKVACRMFRRDWSGSGKSNFPTT